MRATLNMTFPYSSFFKPGRNLDKLSKQINNPMLHKLSIIKGHNWEKCV